MGLYLVPVIFRFELPDIDWGDGPSRGSVADRVSSYSRGSRDEGWCETRGSRSLEPNPIMDVSKNSGTPKSSNFNKVLFHYKPSISQDYVLC